MPPDETTPAQGPPPKPTPPEPATPEGAPTPYRYWAFISYSSSDKAWAKWLQHGIESYGVPAALAEHATPTGEPAPKRLKPLFRDREELAAGDLGAQIEEALAASRYLIVVCSPRAAASKWVEKEIASFQALGHPERVLTLIVEGEPNSGDARECFPPALRACEPLAADARPEGDGKRDARLKLLAGMLGVGFDALKQRDQHRRMRRLQSAVAVVLALLVVFAGLAAYAIVQRDEARAQRSVAVEQRDKAVEARWEAEGVLAYVLFDLRDQLEPLGQLDLIEDVQGMVDAYYASLEVEPGQAFTAHNRFAALEDEAESLLTQGDLDGALEQYEEALALAQSLRESDPDDTVWLRYLSAGHREVGYILEEQGELDGALQHYEASLELAQRLVESEPDNAEWQRDLSLCHDNVGYVLQARGDLDGALQHYEASLEIAEELARTEPGDTAWQRDLLVSHNNVGDSLEAQDDLDGALEHYRAALEIAHALVDSEPDNAQWQRDLAWCHDNVAYVLGQQGDLGGALKHHQASLRIAQSLAAVDPDDVGAWGDVYLSHRNVGWALEFSGDLDGALRHYRAALEVVERLLDSDPENTAWQEDLRDLKDRIQRVLAAQ